MSYFYQSSFFTTTLFVVFFLATAAQAQNVGIGTANPLDKLHINGNVRIDGLVSTDTNVVLSDFNGRLINLGSGNNGEVLTSLGAGRSPIWAASPATDKIHFTSLTNSPSIFALTVSNASAPSGTLLSHTFTPNQDTVLFHFSSEGRISSTVSLAAQPHAFLFRVIVNGTTYKQSYFHVVHGVSGSTTSGFLPASFSMPIAVNAGIANTVQVQIITLFTVSGSITVTYDTTSFSQYAHATVYDFRTN